MGAKPRISTEAMGYLSYYLVLLIASAVAQYPPLLAGLVFVFLVRRWLPDPVVLWRTMGRIDALNRQIQANPANVIARRDLASVYLDRLRPGRALELLAGARERFPDDAELLFLTGVAHARRGEHEKALEPLVKSVTIDPRVRFGEPYLVAGDSLRALERTEAAIDAYERYLELSSSSIEGHVKLALCHRARGARKDMRATLDETFRTWNQLPGFKRRQELGWWLWAWVVRLLG